MVYDEDLLFNDVCCVAMLPVGMPCLSSSFDQLCSIFLQQFSDVRFIAWGSGRSKILSESLHIAAYQISQDVSLFKLSL